jgi:phosphatidylglycerol:prolipoprotein diacylglycerol transferase
MPFVHNIDPVIADAGGVYLWWYGASYTLGFLELHLWFRWQRQRLGLSLRDVYALSIIIPGCVVLFGRLVEVVFYEWPFYSAHPSLMPAVWIGGMSTHGLLLGATVGTWLFCRMRGRDFLTIADELVIPGAFLMGIGRIGNFIDGQIVGSITTMPWGVQFPDAAGFRHPVVLYDGLKNLLLIPLLIAVRRRNPPRGIVLAHFFFWYAFLRIFLDLYREYPTTLLGLATGQSLNIAMALIGLFLMWWLRGRGTPRTAGAEVADAAPALLQRVAFALILIFCLTMPSDWTQDVPRRYSKRHPGLHYSALYPHVSE